MAAPWHATTLTDALAALESQPIGLSEAEARRRLERYGPNRLEPPTPVSALAIFAAQFRSVIVYLLIAAVLVSLFFGDRLEASAIAVVLVINTLIGFVTELRARRAMETLIDLEVPRASVVREGRPRIIDARNLVPGDVVELETGRQVPADARIIFAADLEINEAPLTGESLPVSKTAEALLDEATALADRTNMAYKGTTVVAGIGRAVVAATGPLTEVGRIGVLASTVKLEPTPLERRLDALGHRLVWLTLGVAAVVASLALAHGLPLDVVVETAIALAVAAVPEALPAVATIALAVGVRRMARRQALVRRLPVVEALGSTTVVCTDKTRTLTSGLMAVVRVWAGGEDAEFGPASGPATRGRVPVSRAVAEVIETAALASRAQGGRAAAESGWRGDPVDIAMIDAAEAAGIDPAPRVDRSEDAGLLPFSSSRKFMATFRRVDARMTAAVKGAPRMVLDRCRDAATARGVHRLDAAERTALSSVNERLAGEGLRVIAVARGEVADSTEAALTGLTFLGFVGLADPPAPGVRDTIARLADAGLRTVMLTGDQRHTAEAMGRSLGVLGAADRAVDGRELDAHPPRALGAVVARHAAFSRITPEHKLTIVRARQAEGEVVAMLGDGVNDAAALRQADVGVAMGVRGTDVAKQASAIVLQDDRFDTIAAAVEEGRVIFDNIRKFVFYLFSCNVAEIFVLLGAGVVGLPLPLLPLQLLWLNLVTDTFPALALAIEPAEEDVMRRPPRRPDEAILSRRFIGSILAYGALITACTLTAFVWGLDVSPAHASTLAFMTLALAQTFHLGNARSRVAVLRPALALANPIALGAVALSVGLQLVAATVPMLAAILHVTPLAGRDWAAVVALAAIPAAVGQAIKTWQARS
jgi:Ca2+-transporting ATPase